MREQKHLDAINALNKIVALTSAALYLQNGSDEIYISIQLMEIVRETAVKVEGVSHE